MKTRLASGQTRRALAGMGRAKAIPPEDRASVRCSRNRETEAVNAAFVKPVNPPKWYTDEHFCKGSVNMGKALLHCLKDAGY